MKHHINIDDTVTVISGGHKGESGRVVKVDRKANKAFIAGVNLRERHYAKSAARPQGGSEQIHLGIDLSNLKKEDK